jgi:CRISPR-associated protein Cas1
MRSLYISQQGCYVKLSQEKVLITRQNTVLAEAQLPLIDQILVFGKSQLTTQVIRACLQRGITIAYLSRMGYCYGRILPIEQEYRYLSRYQQNLQSTEQLKVAQQIVFAKLRNSRVLLMRQQRRLQTDQFELAIKTLDYLAEKALTCDRVQQLFGYEGSGASAYFSVLGDCINNSEFVFLGRTRRPPTNPVNAMLSFGYQILWNHILSLIELQGLDPYYACLHQGTARHAALASDLIEEFRAPIVDSLVLYLINRSIIKIDEDFSYRDSGCYLNDSGRKKFLRAFVMRMEESVQMEDSDKELRWNLITQQIRKFKAFIYSQSQEYKPYIIR